MHIGGVFCRLNTRGLGKLNEVINTGSARKRNVSSFDLEPRELPSYEL
jgi:hypothetical protein